MTDHLLGIRGLSEDKLLQFLHNGLQFVEINEREIKKVPSLRGRSVINLFLEPSTRTRVSFELAGKRLSADTINISGGESSTKKGETLLDTVRTIEAMAPDAVVIRSGMSGAPDFLAQKTRNIHIINAGDGLHEHPTQALLDCLTLQQHFHDRLQGLSIAIVGDVYHSRVARSNVLAHLILGNHVRLVGPTTLVPSQLISESSFTPLHGKKGSVAVYHSLEEGLKGADVVMVLRMQLERQTHFFVPSLEEYSREFGVSERILQSLAPNAVVLHPGPINRGVELASDVANGARSLIPKQVRLGVAMRMAVLFTLLTSGTKE